MTVYLNGCTVIFYFTTGIYYFFNVILTGTLGDFRLLFILDFLSCKFKKSKRNQAKAKVKGNIHINDVVNYIILLLTNSIDCT